MSYVTRKLRAASERGKRMAKRRWEIDGARREALAAMEPARFQGLIVRRIVVIDRETEVREAVIYDFDSARKAKRKIQRVLKPRDLTPGQ